MFITSSDCFADRSKAVILLWIVFVINVSCYAVMSVPCSHVFTCSERAGLLALLGVHVFLSLSHMVFRVRYGT